MRQIIYIFIFIFLSMSMQAQKSNTDSALPERIDQLISQLTLEEKASASLAIGGGSTSCISLSISPP